LGAVRWRCREREFDLGARTLVMGIVNVTPDSFSDGGRYLAPDAAIAHGRRLVAEGAEVVDVGAESTRPGASPVPAEEQVRRLLAHADGRHESVGETRLAHILRGLGHRFTAQVVVSELVLRATTDLFDTLGASGTSRAKALDRHWRNARTHTLHDPVRWKLQHIGRWTLTGTPPPRHGQL